MTDRYKAIAHPARRQILRLLRKGPLTAGKIGAELSLPASTLSQHLRALREARLVRIEKSGTTITFFVSESVSQELLNELVWLLKRVTHEK